MEGQPVDSSQNPLNNAIIHEGNFKLFSLDFCFTNLTKVINQGLKYLLCTCCLGTALEYLSIVLKGSAVSSLEFSLCFLCKRALTLISILHLGSHQGCGERNESPFLSSQLPQAPRLLYWATWAEKQTRAAATTAGRHAASFRFNTYSTEPKMREMLVKTWKDQLEKKVFSCKTEELDSDFGPVMAILLNSGQFLILTCASVSQF